MDASIGLDGACMLIFGTDDESRSRGSLALFLLGLGLPAGEVLTEGLKKHGAHSDNRVEP